MRNRDEVRALVTGIGMRNAERSVLEAFQLSQPQHVFTCGFAGALNPELRTGEVVFDASTTRVDVGERLRSLGAKPGRFVCATRIATTTAEKHQLRDTSGADAVEMESEAIQSLCRQRNISCATVRVISDAADEDLPLDFNQLQRPDLSLDYGKLMLAIAKSPNKISALLRLQKNCERAAERLAWTLVQIILE